MEPLKNIQQVHEEVLTIVNEQIAHRRYMLDELVGSLYPSTLRAELENLEALKEQILKLGEDK